MGMLPLLGAGGSGGGVVLLFDTFTDADGTGLAAHTMDVGPGWSVLAGTVQVESDKADSGNNSANTSTYAAADCGHADATVSADVTTCGSAGQGNNGLVVRAVDASNLWYIDIVPAAGVNLFRLVELNTGSHTVRASASVNTSVLTTYTVQAVTAGTSITATLDGGNAINYASATFQQTATKHGIAGRQGNMGDAGSKHDNFRVTT